MNSANIRILIKAAMLPCIAAASLAAAPAHAVSVSSSAPAKVSQPSGTPKSSTEAVTRKLMLQPLPPLGKVDGEFSTQLTGEDITAVPEPGTLALFGLGLLGLGLARRRRAE